MRVAFDHQAFCLQKLGGISRYYCRLAEALQHHANDSIAIFAPLYRNLYLRTATKEIVHGYPILDYPAKTAGFMVSANDWVAKYSIKRWRPDIVHETYFSASGTAPTACPTVLTVFDMIPELAVGCGTVGAKPPSFDANFKTSKKYAAIMRADHVICISQHTRLDLINLFQVPAVKLSVTYLGCDVVDSEDVFENYRMGTQPRPYLLYVGDRQGYKNFENLLRAISSAPRLIKEFDLIAFGGGKFSEHEQSLIRALGFNRDQVRQQPGDDLALNLAYRGAAALVYPSAYEGFGLPPLEAMARNCPVISSNTSSMPEVIGNAGEYFDPQVLDSISGAIEAVVFSKDRTQQLVRLGRERVRLFTWQRCAQETRAVYQAVLNASSSTGMQ
jgi:glycosyltransferase involved in cell wall biosynthesis